MLCPQILLPPLPELLLLTLCSCMALEPKSQQHSCYMKHICSAMQRASQTHESFIKLYYVMLEGCSAPADADLW